jgi:hypothetical protein
MVSEKFYEFCKAKWIETVSCRGDPWFYAPGLPGSKTVKKRLKNEK